MIIVLIHWRIKPDADAIAAFLDYWKTEAIIQNRQGLVGEFLSDAIKPSELPYITWHLDPDSLGDFHSYVNVGIWANAESFHEQVAQYFNDQNPMKEFEAYRRRRIVLRPLSNRVGEASLPTDDSANVR